MWWPILCCVNASPCVLVVGQILSFSSREVSIFKVRIVWVQSSCRNFKAGHQRRLQTERALLTLSGTIAQGLESDNSGYLLFVQIMITS